MNSRTKWHSAILAAGIGLFLLAADARAAGYKVQRFEPTWGYADFFEIYGSYVPDGFNYQIGLYVNYSDGPLTLLATDGTTLQDSVEGQLYLDVGGTIQLYKWVEIGVNFPTALYQFGDGVPGVDKLDSTAIGDLRIDGKLNLVSRAGGVFSMAVVPTVRVPTSIDYLTGLEGVAFTPHLVTEIDVWRIRLALDFNYTLQKQEEPEELSEVSGGHLFGYGGALEVEIVEDMLYAIGELSAETDAHYPYKHEATNPLEGLAGGRLALDNGFRLSAGAGGALLPGIGAPNWRVFLSLGFATPREPPPPPPPPDKDGDGLLDIDDKCPDEAEDKDGFQDQDGCPDPDNDQDGVLDGSDRCPKKKEDKDGFQDQDGCPDDDNDKDGIKDADDKCPDKPEDKDGFEDQDGCPDDDNDGDGIKDADDKCPDKPESMNGTDDEDGCPEGDQDKDGILDAIDQCPADKEDMDGWEDEDGCPDLDNDNDGIRDKRDKCPRDAEDKDGYKDKDGCPDLDNDNDGVLDENDKCPRKKEDKDGFEDEDGCPDPDNDQDGIPDKRDKCPNEKETINGYKDKDGCPDEGKTLVVVTKERIEIKDKVYFRSGSSRILRKSFNLLNQVALTLKAHSEIKVIEIQGYTDDRGKARKNRRISKKRAKAVRSYLIRKGVSKKRLRAQGYGEDNPIDDNTTKAGRANNRRVEFVILQQD